MGMVVASRIRPSLLVASCCFKQEILAVTPSREAGKDWRWPEEAEEGEEEPEEVLLLLLQEEAEQAILRPGLQAPSLEDH